MVRNLVLMYGLVCCCGCVVDFCFWIYWWVRVLPILVVSCVCVCALVICYSWVAMVLLRVWCVLPVGLFVDFVGCCELVTVLIWLCFWCCWVCAWWFAWIVAGLCLVLLCCEFGVLLLVLFVVCYVVCVGWLFCC